MNHIARLIAEREELREHVANVRAELAELECYLTSSKFTAPGCDFVHVRTDILPKLARIRFSICGA